MSDAETRPDSWCPASRPGLAERLVDGEAVIVNAEGGEILVLNEVGAHVWQRLDGETDVKSLAEAVCAEFDVEREVAERDVRSFLAQLERQGALVAD